jgi:hypothetical protein
MQVPISLIVALFAMFGLCIVNTFITCLHTIPYVENGQSQIYGPFEIGM